MIGPATRVGRRRTWLCLLISQALAGGAGLPVGALALPVSPEPTYPELSFGWTVTGSGTETWYTDNVVMATHSLSDNGGESSVTKTFTSTIGGKATFSYSLWLTTCGGCSGYASVEITDITGGGATEILDEVIGIVSGRDNEKAGNGDFNTLVGHTYRFKANAYFHGMMDIQPSKASASLTVRAPDHVDRVPHTATRTATGSGSGLIKATDGEKNLGGFYAMPQPQQGGTVSGIAYQLACINQNVVVLFSDTRSATTANPNAFIIARTIAAPSITSQPQSRTANPGEDVTFTVTAAGAGTLRYRWQFKGADIPGATSPTLTLNDVTLSDAGSYVVVVSNPVGTVPSAPAALTVAGLPVIVEQPQSQTARAGETVHFTVVATGAQPLSYLWCKEGLPLAGATNDTLTLANVQAGDAGSYTVRVTNAAGTTPSEPATLSIPGATSVFPAQYTNGVAFVVKITVAPPAGTSVYAVQDQPPAEWPVSSISGGGVFTGGKVTWLFADGQARTLTYTVCPPAKAFGKASFVGRVSFDLTTELPIAGQRECDNPQAARIAIESVKVFDQRYARLTLTGMAGKSYRLEATSGPGAFSQWTPLITLNLTNATRVWLDPESPLHSWRIYRAVLTP